MAGAALDRPWLAAFLAWIRVARERPLGPRRRALGQALRASAGLLPFPPARRAGAGAASAEIPRTVWMYWDAGEAAAPPLARLCIESWRARNPGWRVEVLDRAAARDRCPLPEVDAGASVQIYSDALRLRLLRREGGVWADASAYCARPLDAWLPAAAPRGATAFRSPEWDRPLSSWCLASAPGARLTALWDEAMRAYWRGEARSDRYFLVHYLFDWCLAADARQRADWAATPAPAAAPAHDLQWALRADDPALDAAGLAALRSAAVPVHKLDWRLEARLPKLRRLLDAAGATA